jgi:beta-phosphoglucomutase-like phosphatase (HAD superfamily)
VFIYAAGWMQTPVKECLVLEDSEPGVRAARAAGLRVGLGKQVIRFAQDDKKQALRFAKDDTRGFGMAAA